MELTKKQLEEMRAQRIKDFNPQDLIDALTVSINYLVIIRSISLLSIKDRPHFTAILEAVSQYRLNRNITHHRRNVIEWAYEIETRIQDLSRPVIYNTINEFIDAHPFPIKGLSLNETFKQYDRDVHIESRWKASYFKKMYHDKP